MLFLFCISSFLVCWWRCQVWFVVLFSHPVASANAFLLKGDLNTSYRNIFANSRSLSLSRLRNSRTCRVGKLFCNFTSASVYLAESNSRKIELDLPPRRCWKPKMMTCFELKNERLISRPSSCGAVAQSVERPSKVQLYWHGFESLSDTPRNKVEGLKL